ncbi:hypothetical protein GCM10028795_19790 [Lysobacter olei]
MFGGLTRDDAAELLGVSLRTIGHWETGKARPTYAAYKLLRQLKHGELADPAWAGYRIVRGKLVTPENHSMAPADMAWLTLLCRRAAAFTDLVRKRDTAKGHPGVQAHARSAAAPAPAGLLAPLPPSLLATGPEGIRAPAKGVGSYGLVYSSTSETQGGEKPGFTGPQGQGAGQLVGAVDFPPGGFAPGWGPVVWRGSWGPVPQQLSGGAR